MLIFQDRPILYFLEVIEGGRSTAAPRGFLNPGQAGTSPDIDYEERPLGWHQGGSFLQTSISKHNICHRHALTVVLEGSGSLKQSYDEEACNVPGKIGRDTFPENNGSAWVRFEAGAPNYIRSG